MGRDRLFEDRLFEGQPDFAERLLPALRSRPYFRPATDEEIDRSLDAYRSGDIARLVSTWADVAAPVRARLEGLDAFMLRHAGALPRRLLGLSFLSLTRGVLEAGKRSRSALRPEVNEAIATEFPWLEARHEHIPPGWSPRVDFPPEFAAFLEGGSLDDARARWQLLTALNEVQQTHCSKHLAALFRVEELSTHAERERELALNYFSHWAPRVTRPLWVQSISVLDGLNAAVFAAMSGGTGIRIRLHAFWGMFAHGAEWEAFRAGLGRQQTLVERDSSRGQDDLGPG